MLYQFTSTNSAKKAVYIVCQKKKQKQKNSQPKKKSLFESLLSSLVTLAHFAVYFEHTCYCVCIHSTDKIMG